MRIVKLLAVLLLLSLPSMAQTFISSPGTKTLESSITKAASYSGSDMAGLGGFRDLVVTLKITSAERDSANETYDFYITTGDGVSSWDIAHFPQIAATGAKTYTAIISGTSRPVNTTTAGPGVEAVTTATMKTDTAAADQGIKTLGAGYVRHGSWGDRIGYQLVVAGTVVTGISYSITITPK